MDVNLYDDENKLKQTTLYTYDNNDIIVQTIFYNDKGKIIEKHKTTHTN